jgi:hypothetical protein
MRLFPRALHGFLRCRQVKSLLQRAATPVGVMYGAYCASAFGLPALFLSVGLLICAVSGAAALFHWRSAAQKRRAAAAKE